MAAPNFAPAHAARAALVWLLNNRDRHSHLESNNVQFALHFRDNVQTSRGKDVPYRVKIIRGADAFRARNDIEMLTAASVPVTRPESAPGVVDCTTPQVAIGPSEPFVDVEISLPIWQRMDAASRIGMLDEALCRVQSGRGERSGNVDLTMVLPDVELFADNVQAFPNWKDGVSAIIEALEASAQVALPLEEIGPLDAQLSPELAARIMGEEEPEAAEQDDAEPTDFDDLPGELRVAALESEPGDAADAVEYEAGRHLQDVAEEIREPEAFQAEQSAAPTLTLEEGGAPKPSRRKSPEEIRIPDASGFAEHKAAKREENLVGAGAA